MTNMREFILRVLGSFTGILIAFAVQFLFLVKVLDVAPGTAVVVLSVLLTVFSAATVLYYRNRFVVGSPEDIPMRAFSWILIEGAAAAATGIAGAALLTRGSTWGAIGCFVLSMLLVLHVRKRRSRFRLSTLDRE